MTAAARMRAPLLLADGNSAPALSTGASAGGGSTECEVGRAFATYALQRAVAKARKVERAANRATAAIIVLAVALMPAMLLNFIMSFEGKPPIHASALYQTLALELIMPLSVMVVLFFAAAYSLTAEEVLTRRFLSVWFALMMMCMVCYSRAGTRYCPGLFHSGWPLSKFSITIMPCLVPSVVFFFIEYARGGALASGFDSIDCLGLFFLVYLVSMGFYGLRLGLAVPGPLDTAAYVRTTMCIPFWISACVVFAISQRYGRGRTRMTCVGGSMILTMFNVSLVEMVFWSAFPCSGFSPYEGQQNVTQVVSIAIPLVLVFVWTLLYCCRGRYIGFQMLKFERKQAIQDGAVIASLLEIGSVPAVGDAWWLHGGDALDGGKAARWYKGRVTQLVSGQFFTVELEGAALADAARDGALARIEHPARLPAPLPLTPSELVGHAASLTRVVAFDAITVATLGGAQGGPAEYALSRPLRRGERIDWFISHSWHEGAESKFSALQAQAAEFRGLHGRWPTCWLDKVCIDQASIGDSLKCLPVFLQSCDQVVALVGSTYFGRLWCVWELYSRVAFSAARSQDGREGLLAAGGDEEQGAMGGDGPLDGPRVRFVPLSCSGGWAALRERVRAFELSRAACFDPNEQSKLMRAIVAADGGSAAFEQEIRGMAALLPGGRHTSRLAETEAAAPLARVYPSTGESTTPPTQSRILGSAGPGGTAFL
eukprot:g6361.t1